MDENTRRCLTFESNRTFQSLQNALQSAGRLEFSQRSMKTMRSPGSMMQVVKRLSSGKIYSPAIFEERDEEKPRIAGGSEYVLDTSTIRFKEEDFCTPSSEEEEKNPNLMERALDESSKKNDDKAEEETYFIVLVDGFVMKQQIKESLVMAGIKPTNCLCRSHVS